LKKAEESDEMVRSKLLDWEDIIVLLSGEKVSSHPSKQKVDK